MFQLCKKIEASLHRADWKSGSKACLQNDYLQCDTGHFIKKAKSETTDLSCPPFKNVHINKIKYLTDNKP